MALSVLVSALPPIHRKARRACLFSSLLVVLTITTSVSYGQQPQSDPQAVAIASQAIAALTGGNAINDVTLMGNVTWSGGSTPESGTVALLALGTGESRMNLSLPDGTRSEIRDSSTGIALGEWIAQNGTSGMFASQNCATDAVWFFPPLGSLAAGSGVVFTYVGEETRNGGMVQHIQSYIYQPNPQGLNPSPQQLSTIDFYLDATTLLPVAVAFNAHPDSSSNTNMGVEIDFSNYQAVNQVLVPTHIQKSLQGNVLLDMTISSVAFNTGLTLSDFVIH